MADRILAFLDRNTVLQLMTSASVAPFCDHFHVSDYYCPLHGTKHKRDLERESGEAVEAMEEVSGGDVVDNVVLQDAVVDNAVAEAAAVKSKEGDTRKIITEDNGDGDDSDTLNSDKKKAAKDEQTPPPAEEENEGKTTVEVRCIDCVEAALGNYRCQECEDFEPENDIFDCDYCDIRRCRGCHCDDYPAGDCEKCKRESCGRGDGCPRMLYCENCYSSHCKECEAWDTTNTCAGACRVSFCNECKETEMRECDVCQKDSKCVHCFYNDCGNTCDKCEKHFCEGSDCPDIFHCESCDSFFCSICDITDGFCDVCELSWCKSCLSGYMCNSCGKSHDVDCAPTVCCEACGKPSCQDCQNKPHVTRNC